MIDAARHDRVRCVFHEVRSAPPQDRGAVLDAACDGNDDLRREVESLLRYADAPGIDLERSGETLRASWREAVRAPAPQRVGRWRILGTLGSGGMGVVYLAEQDRPRRTVAIKMLHRGFVTERHRRRFELESEILGRLDHPGIARIFEAGTEGSCPYFVMEYVDGRPLTRWLEETAFDTPARVRLLLELCDAVAHAHQRGVIHRDLKPANVLVDKCGRTRVLDFGVARASGASEVETLQTSAGEVMGTLPYMSPEQLDGDPGDVDVRSDVYALGVIAYEVLAGCRPIEAIGASLPAAIRAVLNAEPRRLGAVDSSLTGDLELIVAKAMTKDPDARYANVVELAADLRHWLAQEPITARPPSRTYQLRKFAARNRTMVAAAATVFAVLLIAVIAITMALFVARGQRDAAVEARAEVTDALADAQAARDVARRQRDGYASLLAAADLGSGQFAELERWARGDGGWASVDGQVQLHALLGQAAFARGRLLAARHHLHAALNRFNASGPAARETEYDLVWTLLQVESDLSLRESRRPRERWRQLADSLVEDRHPELARTLRDLDAAMPDIMSAAYSREEIERLYHRVRSILADLPDDDLLVQVAADRLAEAGRRLRGRDAARARDAEAFARAALTERRRHLLETSPRVVRARASLVETVRMAGAHEESATEARLALAQLEPVLPADHLLLGALRLSLGRALREQERYAEAEVELRKARSILEGNVDDGSRLVWNALSELVSVLDARGRTTEADHLRDEFAAAVATNALCQWSELRQVLSGRYVAVRDAFDHARAQRTHETIEAAFTQAFATLRATVPEDHSLATAVAIATCHWVNLWINGGGPSTASQGVIHEIERITRAATGDPAFLGSVCLWQVHHAARAGDLEAAERYAREGIDVFSTFYGENSTPVMFIRLFLCQALYNVGRAEEALPHASAAYPVLLEMMDPGNFNVAEARVVLSQVHHATEPAERARRRDVLYLRHATSGPRREMPRVLDAAAWMVSSVPGHDAPTYAVARKAAEGAATALPTVGWVLRTLAIARYRDGDAAGALEALERSGTHLYHDRPELCAIQAMSHKALGAEAAARTALQRARDLLAHPEWSHDPLAAGMVDEAARVVGGR